MYSRRHPANLRRGLLLECCERDLRRGFVGRVQTVGEAWAIERPLLRVLPAEPFDRDRRAARRRQGAGHSPPELLLSAGRARRGQGERADRGARSAREADDRLQVDSIATAIRKIDQPKAVEAKAKPRPDEAAGSKGVGVKDLAGHVGTEPRVLRAFLRRKQRAVGKGRRYAWPSLRPRRREDRRGLAQGAGRRGGRRAEGRRRGEVATAQVTRPRLAAGSSCVGRDVRRPRDTVPAMEAVQVYETTIIDRDSGRGFKFVVAPRRYVANLEVEDPDWVANLLGFDGLRYRRLIPVEAWSLPFLVDAALGRYPDFPWVLDVPGVGEGPRGRGPSGFAQHLTSSPVVPVESSPLGGKSLAELVTATGSVGAAVGCYASGDPLVLLVVPAGIVVCGAAHGVVEGLRPRRRRLRLSGSFTPRRSSRRARSGAAAAGGLAIIRSWGNPNFPTFRWTCTEGRPTASGWGCAALLFVENAWVHRRVERIEILSAQLVRRSVSVDFTVPPQAVDLLQLQNGGQSLIPVATLSKRPLHNFDLRDEGGRAVAVVGKEHNGLVAHAALLAQAELALADRERSGPSRRLVEALEVVAKGAPTHRPRGGRRTRDTGPARRRGGHPPGS